MPDKRYCEAHDVATRRRPTVGSNHDTSFELNSHDGGLNSQRGPWAPILRTSKGVSKDVVWLSRV